MNIGIAGTAGMYAGLGLGLCLMPVSVAAAQSAPDSAPEMKQLLSRLQSMSHGYASAREWNEVIDQIHDQIAAYEEAGDLESMIDVTTVLANVYSQMLGNHPRGIEVLQDLKTFLADKDAEGVHKLYVRLAEIYARTGDRQAIDGLIAEFRESPYYDPKPYTITPATEPGETWTVQRPFGAGDDSLTVSAMRKYARDALFAPGRTFPDVELIGRDGTIFRLREIRGKVMLIDFWLKGWSAWERDVPNLVALHDAYEPKGLVVIGVPLRTDIEMFDDYLAAKGITWTQAEPTRELLRACGVTGDATNFLIDQNGRILGRDLRGGALSETIRKAVGP